jgi:DNA replication protein DnaC
MSEPMPNLLLPSLPPPPEEACEVCGKPLVFAPRERGTEEAAIIGKMANLKLSSIFYYDRLPHVECAEAVERRRKEEVRKELERRELEQREEEIAKWYASEALPLDVRQKTFESFAATPDNQHALQRLNAWRPGDDFGFLISGPAGTGKSHLGFALLNRIIEDYRSSPTSPGPSIENLSAPIRRRYYMPAYFSISEMLASMRARDGSSDLNWRLTHSQAVLLDDLGTESITDWSRDILFRIFDYRLNHRLPTFVTSNLTLNELKERLHERVTSRIIGLCIPVMLKGKDRRMDVLADKVKLLNSRITG